MCTHLRTGRLTGVRTIYHRPTSGNCTHFRSQRVDPSGPSPYSKRLWSFRKGSRWFCSYSPTDWVSIQFTHGIFYTFCRCRCPFDYLTDVGKVGTLNRQGRVVHTDHHRRGLGTSRLDQTRKISGGPDLSLRRRKREVRWNMCSVLVDFDIDRTELLTILSRSSLLLT